MINGQAVRVGQRIKVSTVSGSKDATYEGPKDLDFDHVRIRWFPSGKIAVVEKRRIQGWDYEADAARIRGPRPSARRNQKVEPAKSEARAADDTIPMIDRDRLARLTPQPKPAKPIRSKAYLAFVRERPCASCRMPGPSDPHHYGGRGMSQKTDDLRTVPLCRKCHDHFHDHARLPNMDVGTTRVLLLQRQVDLLIEWVRAQESEAEDG